MNIELVLSGHHLQGNPLTCRAYSTAVTHSSGFQGPLSCGHQTLSDTPTDVSESTSGWNQLEGDDLIVTQREGPV